MPIKKAAVKALRSSKKRYAKNTELKSQLKEAIKKTTEKNINETFSLLDKAAKSNLVHKNKASRIKSQLAKKIGKTPKAENKKTHSSPTKKLAKKTSAKVKSK